MSKDKHFIDGHEAGLSRRGLLKVVAGGSALATFSGGTLLSGASAEAADARTNDCMTELGARAAVTHIRNGDISSEAYVTALLQHQEAHQDLNAFISIDPERVKRDASRVDAARARGEELGPLAGLPVAFKDQIDVAGYQTTVGSKVMQGYVARKNAVVTETLLSAGAVAMGKTNMADLLTRSGLGRHFPMPRNPYDLSRMTGGSSAGNGAAIAARIAPVGIGEDTGGSVRWPAANCGICGFRPSTYAFENYFKGTHRKRYSGEGLVMPPTWVETMGPMARTVTDIAFLDEVITGDKVQPTKLPGTRIGIPRSDYWQRPHDPLVRKAINDVIAALRDAGAQMVEVDLNSLISLSEHDRLGPMVAQGGGSVSEWLAKHHPAITVADIEAEKAISQFNEVPKNYPRMPAPPTKRPRLTHGEQLAIMRDAWEKYSGVFRDEDIVALAMPTMLMLPPLIDFRWGPRDTRILVNGEWVEEWDLTLTNVWWGSRFGAPALSLPAGLEQGLPVGLQLQGMPGDDSRILGLGMEVEKTIGSLPAPTFRHEPI